MTACAFVYAYPLQAPLNPLFATAIFAGELLWVAAMLASYWRAPAAAMWKLILVSGRSRRSASSGSSTPR